MLFGSLFLPKNPSFFCPLLCFKSGLLPTFSGLFTFLTGKIRGVKAFTCAFAQKKWAFAHFQNPKVGENYV